MKKPTVLLDLSEINNYSSGFGQLENNYARLFPEEAGDSLHFHYLLPPNCDKALPAQVSTTSFRRKFHKFFTKGLPAVDLWHTTNQLQLKRKCGKCRKYVLTIHDLNYLTEKGWLSRMKHHIRLQRAINRADAVTAISQYVAKQIEREFRLGKGKKPIVIYNGVEHIEGRPAKQPAFARQRPFFFTIGQIRKKKNFQKLVEMMAYLPDYDLYICGDDHFSFARRIRRQTAALPTGNAFLCGKISEEEKIWLYANCRAFLFASEGEGFGLPVIEAMQFGKAVFIANRTCLPEICGSHAFIWETLEAPQMAQLVKDCLPGFYQDEERIAAEKEHAAKFSYTKHIQAYLQLYHELLEEEENEKTKK